MDTNAGRDRRKDPKMTLTLRRFAFYLLIAVCLGVIAHGQTVSPSKDLPNLYKVNAKLYRGGQPTESGIKRLANMGVKTIVDLRDNDDRAKKEESWAHAAGLRFINEPEGTWGKPTRESIANIIKQIDRADDQPVFVHCKRGSDRTGTVIAVYRITHDGWTDKQANAEAKKFGFGWWQFWMKDFINDYYRDFKNRDHRP